MRREEAMDFLEKCRYWFMPYTIEEDKWNEAVDVAIEALSEPKIGTWREEIEGNGWNEWLKVTCSECGRIYTDLYPRNFCPNCGAKMLREDDD